jgi:hypothetical protein
MFAAYTRILTVPSGIDYLYLLGHYGIAIKREGAPVGE